MTIYASVLSSNFACLRDEVSLLDQAGIDGYHIDIMDGHFVPFLSMGPRIIDTLSVLTPKKLDVHLMVENPENLIPFCLKAHSLTVHGECLGLERARSMVKKAQIPFGLAINPQTDLACLYTQPKPDFVLVMGVQPGQGGQAFLPETIERVRILVQKGYKVHVDGGVNDQWAQSLWRAGAHTLVSGSFLWPRLTDTAASVRLRIADISKNKKIPLM